MPAYLSSKLPADRLSMLRRVILWVIAGLLAVAAAYLAGLIYPGTPSASKSLRFVGYVPLPRRGALNVLDYLTVAGDRLFVASESAGSVVRVPLRGAALPTPAELAALPGKPSPHGVVFDPVSGLAFVSRSGANTVDVFDPAAMRLLKSLPVADDPDGIFYDPQNRLIYVAGGDSKTGTLIDPAAQTVVGTIALGGKPEFAAFDPATGLLFQNLKDTDEVVALDLARRAVAGRWPLPGCRGPSGLALDAANHRLFIAGSQNATVAVFDLAAHRVLATLPVGAHPDSVAYDPALRRVYTAGLDGVTTVLQADASGALRVADNVRTHYGAHTLAVDPATHRLYVGYAGLFAAPRLAVFEAIP